MFGGMSPRDWEQLADMIDSATVGRNSDGDEITETVLDPERLAGLIRAHAAADRKRWMGDE